MMDDTDVIIDDELDVFNDETFGGEGEEYEWDGQDPMSVSTDCVQQRTNQEKPAIKKREILSNEEEFFDFGYEDQEGTYMNVEESISRLVLDDDFDDIEKERDRFVKASHKSLMPPQVISRNLTWMTEKDMANPLFSSSVWSMHPTDVIQTKRQESTIPVGAIPAGAINQQGQGMVSQLPSRPPPGLVQNQKPSGFRTLEEIEHELLTSSVKGSAPEPPRNFPRREHDIESLLLSGNNENAQIHRGPFPQFLNQGLTARPPPQTPGFGRPGGRGLLGHPPQPQGAPIYPFDLRQQMPIPNMGPGIQGPFPHGMPPAFRQQQQRFRANFEFMRNRAPGMFPLQQFIRSRHPMPGENSMNYNLNGNGGRERVDEVMNEKDKQRLRNIQMLQLQNDHPYTTDFYFQIKKYKDSKNARYLAKVFPLSSNIPHRNPYVPMRFENALGKLQAVSALAPKKIIDTFIRVHCSSGHNGSSQAKTLMGIETIYKLYLDLKEYHYRKIAETLDNGYDEKEEFFHYSRILEALDRVGSDLTAWLGFKKGRSLLLKLILEFNDFHKGHTAAYMIGQNYSAWKTFLMIKNLLSTTDLSNAT